MKMKKNTVKIMPVKNFYDKESNYILRAAGVPFDATPERAEELAEKGLLVCDTCPNLCREVFVFSNVAFMRS